MPHISVWLHFVWTTKDREPLLTESIRHKVFDHIRKNARAKDIFIGALNGWVEHVHCLISLGSGQTIDDIMRLLKGESSFWINKQQMCRGKFHWQDEYFVVSVSESVLPNVRKYIDSQEEHQPALLTKNLKIFWREVDSNASPTDNNDWAKARILFTLFQ